MRSLCCALMVLVCLTVVGCRVDPRIELLERENRMLEDEIYRLQWTIEDMQNGVSGPLIEPPRRNERPSGEPQPPRPMADEPTPAPVDPIEQAKPKFNGQKISPEEFLERHKSIQIPGVPDVPEHLQGPSGGSPSPETPSTQDDSSGPALSLLPAGMAAPLGSRNSRNATELALDGRRTGGFDANGRPGDEGVSVVLLPRDDRGLAIDAPGKISIAVLDPALPGEAARVARWDFSRDDVAQLMADARGRGIELNMIWPDDLPQHEDLHLFARYETADGRKLQADQPIRVDLTRAEHAARPTGWTVSDEPPPDPEPAKVEAADSPDSDEPGLLPETSAKPLAATDSPLHTANASEQLRSDRDPATPTDSEKPASDPADALERPSWSPERR